MKKHFRLLGGVLIVIALALVAGCAKEQPTREGSAGFSSAPAVPPTPPAGEPSQEGTGMEGEEKFTYTCPMHPEVEQERPGRCSECDMFLVAQVGEDTEVEYYCPMDEGQESDKAGECSECGMFLVARTKAAAGEAGAIEETKGGTGE